MGIFDGPIYFKDDFFDFHPKLYAEAGLVTAITGSVCRVSSDGDGMMNIHVHTPQGDQVVHYDTNMSSGVSKFDGYIPTGAGIRAYVLTTKGAWASDTRRGSTLQIIIENLERKKERLETDFHLLTHPNHRTIDEKLGKACAAQKMKLAG
jgi:hypothetical protein